MRLYPNQINAHLKKELLPAYLFSAEEPLLAQECRDTVLKKAKQKGFTDRDLFQVENGFNWDSFYEATNNLSLFGDQNVVDLRFPTAKVDANASKAISNYCDNPNPDTCLIITVPKVDGTMQRSKWFKAIDKLGAWLPIKPLTGRFFLDWLEQRSRLNGLSCSPEVIRLIADRVEGNLLAAAQELDKLQLLLGDHKGPVTEKHIQSAVAHHARYDIFQLMDTLLLGDIHRSLTMLNTLKSEGSEPILLLWAVSRELRTLIQIAEAKQNGTTLAAAMQAQKVWKNRQPLISKAVNRLNLPLLYQLLQLAHNADKAIKGIQQDSVWRIFTDIALGLCAPEKLNLEHSI